MWVFRKYTRILFQLLTHCIISPYNCYNIQYMPTRNSNGINRPGPRLVWKVSKIFRRLNNAYVIYIERGWRRQTNQFQFISISSGTYDRLGDSDCLQIYLNWWKSSTPETHESEHIAPKNEIEMSLVEISETVNTFCGSKNSFEWIKITTF